MEEGKELNSNQSEEKFRKTGLDIIGDVPWGTHLCHFYQTKDDLTDVLVPYFKAGLENNEFCMWITAEPLKVEDAKAALNKELEDLDRYIKKGQIEILDYSQWYTKSGSFEADKVLQSWVEKEEQAIKRGFDGLRFTGNTLWLEERNWKVFSDYEAVVNNVIGKYRMIAICSYSLDKCRAIEVIDVIADHQFALIREAGEWRIIESAERKKEKEEIISSVENIKRVIEGMGDGVTMSDKDGYFEIFNQKMREITGYTIEEANASGDFSSLLYKDPEERQKGIEGLNKVMAKVGSYETETTIDVKNGQKKILIVATSIIHYKGRNMFLSVYRDITERKKAEEELRLYNEYLLNMAEGVIVIRANDSRIIYTNPRFEEILGYGRSELVGKNISAITALTDKPLEEITGEITGILKKKKRWEGEIQNLKKDGTFVWCRATVSTIETSRDGLVWVGVYEDITERKKAEEEKTKLLHDQRKRVKELKCLFDLSDLVEKPGFTLEEILEGMVNLIPPAWQYPEITCARIISENREFKTDNFKDTKWKQSADVKVFGEKAGCIEVFYLKEKPESYEGPFSKEERGLLEVVAERLGRIIESWKGEEKLKEFYANLEEYKKILEQKNIAFQELIKAIEIEKNEIKDNVILNVEEVIIPILKNLKLKRVSPKYLDLLQNNLETLTSSFGRRITEKTFKLTSREIEICNMIKAGMTSKEISNLLNISSQTVNKHRENIRKKLRISKKDINLTSFLKSL